ncbi:MAG TPA: LexA family transcriptional regulator [Saprospiraceae bacterium]|nr:LexA family transcriptional regulator [Saprospiraceae bacterium]
MSALSQNIISKRFVQCAQTLLSGNKVPSARQLALSLEYKPQGLSEILNGKRNAPVELLKRAAEMYKLNVRYLFFGEGEMFENDQSVNTRVIVTDIFQKERIVHVPVAAHAGYRDNLTETVFVQNLLTYSLPENILRYGSYRSFDIAGESMEPTLLPGDKVIGAYVEPQYWEQGIKDNMIHVLVTHREIVVKRVINFIRAEKMLELHSDNMAVLPYHLPIEELREAWVVRLKITANLNKPDGHEILNEIRHTVASLVGRVPVK